MTVQINQPRERRSGLADLAAAINIAGNVFGIRSNIKQDELRMANLDNAKQQNELNEIKIAEAQAQAQQANDFRQSKFETPAQVAFAEKQGLSFGLPGAQGAIGQANVGGNEFSIMTQGTAKNNQLRMANQQKAAQLADKLARDDSASKFDREKKLRDEYVKGAKNTRLSLDGFRKVESAASTPNPTGATDVALVFGFMKTIDPTSTVREGEFATAEQTSGIDDRVVASYNKIIQGERLSPEQRLNFLAAAKDQLRAKMELQIQDDDLYSGLSKRAGADVEDVVINGDLFKNEFERIFQGSGSQNIAGGGTAPAPQALRSSAGMVTQDQITQELQRRGLLNPQQPRTVGGP